jgi:hypothetical protein
MKHLKSFENINNILQIGDYVICSENVVSNKNSKEFIKSNIGRYIKYLSYGKDIVLNYRYVIEYEDVPIELRRGSYDFDWESGSNHLCIRSTREDILFFSDKKEDIEFFLTSKKYNL